MTTTMLFRVGLCCNDERGNPHALLAVDVYSPNDERLAYMVTPAYWDPCEEGEPIDFVAGAFVLGEGTHPSPEQSFPFEARSSWAGNMAWEGVMMLPEATAALLTYLNSLDHWSVEEATEHLFDLLEQGEAITAEVLLAEVSDAVI